MRFCSSRAIFVFLGLLAFGSVHAMPLEGAPELDKRESLADSPVSNENGQPNFSSANALNGLTQVGRRGNTPDIDIRPLLSGREVVPRTTPKTNYVNSGQISTDGSCNVGTAQCCQSLHQSSDVHRQLAGGLLTALIPLDELFVGIQCSPIANVLPILSGGGTCQGRPVCCSGNTYEGLINLGCSPISL